MYDALIVGGGTAGLSAALILARCCRKVAIFDTGKPRNRCATQMNGYLSRDGINPLDFLRISRADLEDYNVSWFETEIVRAEKVENQFCVEDSKGKRWYGRKLLLATGISDNLPEIEGFAEMYGVSVHHCPYCDGWEERDKKIAVYGKGKAGMAEALALKNWSQDVVLCTDGPSRLFRQQCTLLTEKGITLIENPILRLEGRDGQLERIIFTDREPLERESMFFSTGYRQHSPLAYQLSCRTKKRGKDIWVNRLQQSSVEGLYISGDAAYDMKMAIIAAAEGAKAGIAINLALLESEELRII